MIARAVTPILNVADMERSFAWFEKLGWKKDWGSPPTFGGVFRIGKGIEESE